MRQVPGGLRKEAEHVPDLGVLRAGFLHHPDVLGVGPGLRVRFHAGEKHWGHSRLAVTHVGGTPQKSVGVMVSTRGAVFASARGVRTGSFWEAKTCLP